MPIGLQDLKNHLDQVTRPNVQQRPSTADFKTDGSAVFGGLKRTLSNSSQPPLTRKSSAVSIKDMDLLPKSVDSPSGKPQVSPIAIDGIRLDRVKLKHPSQLDNNPLKPGEKETYLVKNSADLKRILGDKPGVQMKYVVAMNGDFYVFPGMKDGKCINHAHFGGQEVGAAGFVKGAKGRILLADAGSTGYETPLTSARKALQLTFGRLPQCFGRENKPFDLAKNISLGRTPTKIDLETKY